jgi:hypothetical protein
MIRISWISKRVRASLLAGIVLILANSPVSAQATGGGSLSTLGGAGSTTAGGMGGTGSTGSTGVASQTAPQTPLGPTTNMGPQVTIRSPTAAFGGTGAANIPATSNPLAPYYYNLYQFGLNTSGTSGNQSSPSSTFGQPLYGTVTTSTANPASTAGQAATSQGTGFTTLGRSRAPAYYTALSEDFVMPQYPAGKIQNDLQRVIQRSSALKGQNIQIVVEGSRVILRGEVTGARERERAEAQVRVTPGIYDYDVQNDLRVTGTAGATAATIQRASH